jgi:hypothetical protein
MECSECVDFGILMKKAKTKEERQHFEQKLMDHWDYQGYFRENYARIVMKVLNYCIILLLYYCNNNYYYANIIIIHEDIFILRML